MKDLNLTRMINVVAAGSLLVTVTGCGSEYKRAAKKFCKGLHECEENYFEDEYDSIGECVETYEEYLEETEEYYGAACAEAYADLMKCFGNEISGDCDYYDVYDNCEDELEETYDACDFGYYYDDYY